MNTDELISIINAFENASRRRRVDSKGSQFIYIFSQEPIYLWNRLHCIFRIYLGSAAEIAPKEVHEQANTNRKGDFQHPPNDWIISSPPLNSHVH